MNTMSLDVTPARSATSVAGARDSARDFLEGLVRPLAAEGADTVLLVVSSSSPTPCGTAAAPAPWS